MPPTKISMVDISKKPHVKRIAIASGRICLKEQTIQLIKDGKIKKGDPLTVGGIAAINAVKFTPQLIPLCHQIPISNIEYETEIYKNFIEVKVIVTSIAQTGVEMEAIVGVSSFLNVIWDMTKYLEKDKNGQYFKTMITDIRVLKKTKDMSIER